MPAVAPVTGKFGSNKLAVLLVDGFNLLAAKVQQVRYKVETIQEKSDGCGDDWEEHTPTGKSRAELAIEGGYFDTNTASSHEALKDSVPGDAQAVPRVTCVAFAGNAIGQPFVGFEGMHEQSYEVLAQLGNLTKANAGFVVSGEAESGAILHAHTVETADGNTDATSVDNTTVPQRDVPITSSSVANPSTITTAVPHGLVTGDSVLIAGHAGSTPSINAEQQVTVTGPNTFTIPVNVTVGGAGGSLKRAKTNAGGSAYLEMETPVLGGFTAAQVDTRHSDDAAAFVLLASFTARTTRGAQRIVLPTNIKRYTAQALDLTGAGAGASVRYFVGITRN